MSEGEQSAVDQQGSAYGTQSASWRREEPYLVHTKPAGHGSRLEHRSIGIELKMWSGWIGLRGKLTLAPACNSERRLGKGDALAAKAGLMPAKRAARTIVAGGAWHVQAVGAGRRWDRDS